jgi:hypothetical protein
VCCYSLKLVYKKKSLHNIIYNIEKRKQVLRELSR